MGLSHLSFHAGTEGKIKRKEIKKAIGHTYRKSEDAYKSHGNKDIDMSRTKYNLDITFDDRSLDEIVEDRLENEYKGKRALRNDAVVVREIIVQPSADIFEGLSFDEQREKAVEFTRDSVEFMEQEFGEKNVLGLSLHMDETNPHIHISIMPMTSDGRISQKDFFKGPGDLKRQHREYREHMNSKGWSFDLDNKYENVDGLSLPKYKANAKEIERKRTTQKKDMDALKSDLDVRRSAEKAVYSDIYENRLKEAQEALDERERALKEREEELNARRDKLQERFKQAVAQNREKYNQQLRTSEKAASERGFKKGVAAGLEKVGAVLNEKMSDNNYVRDTVLKTFEGGKYHSVVTGWDRQSQRKARNEERKRQSMMVEDVMTTQIKMRDDDLEL